MNKPKLVVKKAFIDGKDPKTKALRHFKKGDIYEGDNADHFLKNGNLVKQDDLDLEDHAAIVKKIEAAKAELSGLEAALKNHPGKSLVKEPKPSEKSSPGKKE